MITSSCLSFFFLLFGIVSSIKLFQDHNVRYSNNVIKRRGGDDYEEEDDDDATNSNRRRRRPSREQQRRRPTDYNNREDDRYSNRDRSNRDSREDDRYNNNRNRDRSNRDRKSPSALDTATSLAKKTVDLTSAAAWMTLKGSGKAAFSLVSPKHVSKREIVGVWRLDQSVDRGGESIVCAANVEFTPRGDVIVKFNEDEIVSSYIFRERSWPQSCSIEFEACAFQGPYDSKPVRMRYKGTFRRKFANSNVIKIVGHIYTVNRKKGGWTRKSKRDTGKLIGSFVARRRVMKKERNLDEEDDLDPEYDEYDDLEEEMGEEELAEEEDVYDNDATDLDESEYDDDEL